MTAPSDLLSFLVSRFSFLVSRFSFLVSRFSFIVSRFSFFRFSFLVSRFSFLVHRFSFIGGGVTGSASCFILDSKPKFVIIILQCRRACGR